ncbi:MAG: gliding motility-associated protein GldE [Bacteroidota bacterium]|nr:gliding motility-associated protein GldE [Bacteroidota bacterium]
MDTEPPSSFLIHDGLFLLMAFDGNMIGLIVLIILLLCSGLFSGSEIAMFSLAPYEIDEIKEEKSNAAKALIWFKDHPKRLLSCLLICTTFINIAIALVTERLLSTWIPITTYQSFSQNLLNSLAWVSISFEKLAYVFHFSFALFVSTSLILLFGETTPKFYGQIKSRKLALLMAVPLKIFDLLLRPLILFLVTITTRVEKRLLEKKVGSQATSKKDWDAAIDLAVNQEHEGGQQAEMLKGIINFNDVSTKQVMTPRTQVYAVDFSFNYKELLNIVRESGFSRLPVFNENFDQITGILYVKDLIAHLDEEDSFEWQSLIRTNLLYVPESRKINELLNDFQEKHVHMSFVVDEYGGISGIVTLEDIMEEIVGEINDEFDDQHELNYTRLDQNNYLFDAKTLINDMCRVLGIDIFVFDQARGNSDSIAGLLLENNGEMPRKDQEISICGYNFKVVSLTKKRIEQVKITI